MKGDVLGLRGAEVELGEGQCGRNKLNGSGRGRVQGRRPMAPC